MTVSEPSPKKSKIENLTAKQSPTKTELEAHLATRASRIVHILYDEHTKDIEAAESKIASLFLIQGSDTDTIAALYNELRSGRKMSCWLRELYKRARKAAKTIGLPKDSESFHSVLALGMLAMITPELTASMGFTRKGPIDGMPAAIWQAQHRHLVQPEYMVAYIWFMGGHFRKVGVISDGEKGTMEPDCNGRHNESTLNVLSDDAKWDDDGTVVG